MQRRHVIFGMSLGFLGSCFTPYDTPQVAAETGGTSPDETGGTDAEDVDPTAPPIDPTEVPTDGSTGGEPGTVIEGSSTGDSSTGDGDTPDDPDDPDGDVTATIDLTDFEFATDKADLTALYRHPLQGVEMVPGGVPTVDVQDSPTGGRYMLVDEFGVDSEGYDISTSGVATAEIISHERREHPARKQAKARVTERLTRDVALRLSRGDHSVFTVKVALRRPVDRIPSVAHEMNREIGEGRAVTYGDVRKARQRVLAKIRKSVAYEVSEASRSLRLSGADVFPSQYGHMAKVTGTPTQIKEALKTEAFLIADVDYSAREEYEADLDDEGVGESPALWMEGAQVWELHDNDLLAGLGYDGNDDGSGGAVVYGHMESKLPRVTHRIFREGRKKASRLITWFDCTGDSCEERPDRINAGSHSTHTLSRSAGDTLDHQFDHDQVPHSQQMRYVGQCPECDIIAISERSGNFWEAGAAFLNGSRYPVIIGMSSGAPPKKPGCRGKRSDAVAADRNYFEMGMLLAISAGNENNEDVIKEWPCTVNTPADAVSSLTIGAQNLPDKFDSMCRVQYAPMKKYSGTGPDRKRTVVDIVASGAIYGTARPASDKALDQEHHGGTSVAAPIVAGIGASMTGAYREFASSLITTPGVLKAVMLLTGDRKKYGRGNYSSTGYSSVYGAGRARAMSFDHDWADGADWRIKVGAVCIKDGETLDITPSWLPQWYKYSVKTVVWAYSPEYHEDADVDTLSDVSLEYMTPGFPGPGSTSHRVFKRDNSGDDKKRIYHFAGTPTDERVSKIRIKGKNITTDSDGCGENATHAYFAILTEEEDRTGTPSWDEDTCEGRAPDWCAANPTAKYCKD